MGLYGLASKYAAGVTAGSVAGAENESAAVLFVDSLLTDFHRFADGISAHFAVFAEINGNFQIVLNHGFDAETVRKSISTRDFWNGTLASDGRHILQGESLSGLYQLFSRRDCVFEKLYVKKSLQNERPFIFIAADVPDEQFFEKKIPRILAFVNDLYAISEALFRKEKRAASNPASFENTAASAEKQAAYFIRLNKVFEYLSASLYPSDLDFICTCLCLALPAEAAEPNSDGAAENHTPMYKSGEKSDEAAFAHIETVIQKLLSLRCASLVRIEKASAKDYGAS